MALSKATGGIAAALGVLTGFATLVTALAEPATAACVEKVASALGPQAAAIGASVVGAITMVATALAWFAHPPKNAPGSAPPDPAPSLTGGSS
jgi:hypothetical protein